METEVNKQRQATMSLSNATFFALLEQELIEHGSVRIRVKGISMEPMLRNNRDEVQILPYDGRELTAKDICLFRFQGRHVLHRFLCREGSMCYFRGDNVLARCECCDQTDVVGVVRTIYRDGLPIPPYSEEWQHKIERHRFKQRIRFSLTSHLPTGLKHLLKQVLGMKKTN